MHTIWIDAATPKYALFFATLLPHLKQPDRQFFVTTRYSENYREAKAILDQHGIESHIVGSHGGTTPADKLSARLSRQNQFLELFKQHGTPKALMAGSVVDSIQTAFGLGLPILNFCDTPLKSTPFNHQNVTIVTKLTLPLATYTFYPFVIPEEVFRALGTNPQTLYRYDFIDVALWMKNCKPQNDFRIQYNLDLDLPTILIREEEYKAHYVTDKKEILYDTLPQLFDQIRANWVIMPRYEDSYLKKLFGKRALILNQTLPIGDFYPFIDLLIGGGGTMNLEAAYLGIPVISTRSLRLYHDHFLIDNQLMTWTASTTELAEAVLSKISVGKKNHQLFVKNSDSIARFIQQLKEQLACAVL